MLRKPKLIPEGQWEQMQQIWNERFGSTTPAEPPLPATPSVQGSVHQGWFYLGTNGEHLGPISATELRALVTDAKISRGRLVWHHGLEEWSRLEDVWGLLEDVDAPDEPKPEDPPQPQPPKETSALADRFWSLHPVEKAGVLHPWFVDRVVNDLAKSFATSLLAKDAEVRAIFGMGEVGAPHLAGELGAMVLDGYIVELLSHGRLPESPVLKEVEESALEVVFAEIKVRWGASKAEIENAEMQELLAELVSARLSMPGFVQLNSSVNTGNHLYLLGINGVSWAQAERAVLRDHKGT